MTKDAQIALKKGFTVTNNTAQTITPSSTIDGVVSQGANGMLVRPRAIYFFENDTIVGRMLYIWNGVRLHPQQVYLRTTNPVTPWEKADTQEGIRALLGRTERGNMGFKWESSALEKPYRRRSFVQALISDVDRSFFTPLQRDYRAKELGEQRDTEMTHRTISGLRTLSDTLCDRAA